MLLHSFLDKDTETFSHLLVDEASHLCAIVDPVLDYDSKSGRTSNNHADKLIEFISSNNWQVKYIIETHAHADHLSSASYLKKKLGGKTVIGRHITKVQTIFKAVFNLDTSFKTDASQFDILTDEGTVLHLGDITITAMHVPGHTPADMAYIAKHHKQTFVFVGDTIFAPDVGTARCDFPGGDANALYASIQRLLKLPQDTLLCLCHDYPPKGRDYQATTTVGEQKRHNKHVKDGISQTEFVTMREARDKTLSMPRLILPSVQVNIRAGELPEPENNGIRYLKVPLNAL
ncbi:MAG: MBL fold metallo-hydrolase [Gammaproteobacteria bacterium]|nr:MAG: MBL fold metallo-hydrolase [Gammaproteobacteria bacterium]